MKRLLILYTSAGAGHQRAAEALVATARKTRPDLEVVSRDALEFMPALVRRYYGRSYLAAVNNSPELWGFMYDYSDRKGADSKTTKLMRFLDRLQAKKLMAFVDDLNPDAIVCTHFLPSNVLLSATAGARGARRAGAARTERATRSAQRSAPPISLVLTDFDVHSFCLHEGMRMYFVPSEEVEHQLLARGVAPEQVAVTGIPVLPVFAEYGAILSQRAGADTVICGRSMRSVGNARALRETLRKQLDVPVSAKVVLLLSGGFGVGHVEDTLRSLAKIGLDFHMLVVAGRNEKLRRVLENFAASSQGRIKVFGFVDNMHDLMAASDVVISKSGGLTVSECLTVGLPMIVMSPIPGQEVANCNYLLENGAVVLAKNLAVLCYKLPRLLSEANTLPAMRARATAIARPDAADRLLELATALQYTERLQAPN